MAQRERILGLDQEGTFIVADADAADLVSQVAIEDERVVAFDCIAGEMQRWKRTRGLDFHVVDFIQVEEPHEANDNSGSACGPVVRKLHQAAEQAS